MAQKLSINICYLYHDLMDTYGDIGNIIALKYRCQKRGIDVQIINISLGDSLKNKQFDIFFFGGGQTKIQNIVSKDLQKKASFIVDSVENNTVLLSICGGYQLLQKYFQYKNGKKINGIGLFDAITEESNKRLIQNLLISINSSFSDEICSSYKSGGKSQLLTNLVGFENHSGKTYLSKNTKPLGYVIKGAGNNGEDKTEGIRYKNAFGCYLHGSLLPKNPHFADFLITKALEKKYGVITLKPLNDTFEWHSHNQSSGKTRSQG